MVERTEVIQSSPLTAWIIPDSIVLYGLEKHISAKYVGVTVFLLQLSNYILHGK